MSGTVWAKFYWADWQSDPKLKLCSLAAQGLWMRMLCIAADAKTVGYVTVDGKPMGAEEIAIIAGQPAKAVKPLLDELERRGVFSRSGKGVIYCRRMVVDQKKARAARKNGKLGGNPTLGKQSENGALVKGGDKPHKPKAKKPEDIPPNPPGGGTANLEGFDEGWSLYPISGRANHGEDLAAAEWPAAVRAAGGAARLIDAIRAHAAQVAASRARVKAFHRWLRDKGFSAYLSRPGAAAAQPADWHGPTDVADVLARGMGDGKAASSYLARCAWQDMPVRAVVAPDEFTRGKLLEAGLGRAGYEVIVRGRAA